jgi:hypothetical protein
MFMDQRAEHLSETLMTGRFRLFRMRQRTISLLGGALLMGALGSAPPASAEPQQGAPIAPPSLPATVPNGTRFLVRLKDELRTDKIQLNKKFKAETLEPISTPDGNILPPGAEIRGHVSRIEPAGLTGRARLWLTFAEIRTPSGKRPLVADVVSVPGDHSVRPGESKEGEIESRTSKGRPEIEAAAAGAAMGAAVGAATKGGKGAAVGAAAGAAAGFLVSSGIGRELDLPKGTKLELELIRPLYLARN